ncbi:hypothetical protein EOD41_01295 [Mucilaginibacter limnophilus]|uniref:SGNH hydrolase-type esterase domain-containing protein n=1 Tax=Mucilaginibacter limnophilus TaxID=1932778 RepID=A0A437MY55_9SPHI|nr:SGNH/GDSL hydrolase family protein [Mucilaginibacter limnophilus]RVU02604.1 hypothetical protein EOD41_01295 [Mucilaginibacter limnophilus]
MNSGRKLLAGILVCLCSAKTISAQTVAPFKEGDRVVFLGNSITDGGHYHSYIWLYYMTHFPNTRITCVNAGIGGDNVIQMGDRLEDDVLSKNPTVLTFTWGMNDTGYFEWFAKDAQETMKKRLAKSFASYNVTADKLAKLSNIRKILILGSPYDSTTKSNPKNFYPGKATAFANVIKFQEQSANDRKWETVDFYHPMLAINKKGQETDSLFSLTPGDRIHPDNDGHMVMAYQFLKSQGFANKPVADVAINGNKIEKSENATVSNVVNSKTGVSFDYLANSLPYPVDTISRFWGNKKSQADGLKLVPFTQEFNREMLTVKGLKKGNYKLLIDGQEIGKWDSKQLASGINLAEQIWTPQYQQALQISILNEERLDIELRFRKYAYVEFDLLKEKGKLFAEDKAALDTVTKYSKNNPFINGNRENYTRAQYKAVRNAWQKQMDAIVNEIYTINKPLKRKIELVLAN